MTDYAALPTHREFEEQHRVRIDAIEAEFELAKEKYHKDFLAAMSDYEVMYAKIWQHSALMED